MVFFCVLDYRSKIIFYIFSWSDDNWRLMVWALWDLLNLKGSLFLCIFVVSVLYLWPNHFLLESDFFDVLLLTLLFINTLHAPLFDRFILLFYVNRHCVYTFYKRILKFILFYVQMKSLFMFIFGGYMSRWSECSGGWCLNCSLMLHGSCIIIMIVQMVSMQLKNNCASHHHCLLHCESLLCFCMLYIVKINIQCKVWCKLQ